MVAGRLADGRPPDRPHANPGRGQPRRSERTKNPRPPSPISTARPRRSSTSTPSRPSRRRGLPDPAHRVRRRGRLRDPLPRRLRRARVGRDPTEAGRRHGIKPFGLEPQRILRLQKMHILVGQDTDSESTPFGAAMPWIVKLDKSQDFIGKWALEHYAQEEPATRLVGFTLADGYVPTEGSVIVDSVGDPAGQVTSARFSPVLDRVIGMAWVPESARARRGPGDDLRPGTHDERADPDPAVLRPRRRGASLVSALDFLSPSRRHRRARSRAARWSDSRKRPAPSSRSATAGTWRSPTAQTRSARSSTWPGPTSRICRKWEVRGRRRRPRDRADARARRGCAALTGDAGAPDRRIRGARRSARRHLQLRRAHDPRTRGPGDDRALLRAGPPTGQSPTAQLPPRLGRPPAGYVLVEGPDRFLLLFGWATAEYMWTVVAGRGAPSRRRPDRAPDLCPPKR